MRRALCQITDRGEMIRLLDSTNVGRLATVDAEGYPYVTPVNFVFHQGCVYFHSALRGEKLDNLARDSRVCFEVDAPLAYLEVDFNPEKNPCRAHQLYHCVIIRGRARLVPEGPLKTAVLNALLAKHEGRDGLNLVGPESPGYRRCCLVEVRPERMTAKSDLAQSEPQRGYRRFIAASLAQRGRPGDLEAVRAMGYEIEGSQAGGWRLKD